MQVMQVMQVMHFHKVVQRKKPRLRHCKTVNQDFVSCKFNIHHLHGNKPIGPLKQFPTKPAAN